MPYPATAATCNRSGHHSTFLSRSRRTYLESHSCMTTDGADKANALTDDCNQVTSAPHSGCNIQENTCDEIRKATQKGCWGLGGGRSGFLHEIPLMAPLDIFREQSACFEQSRG